MVERELPNIIADLAKTLTKKTAARRRLRQINSPRVEAVKFNSPQNTRHFAGDLAVRLKIEIVILSSLSIACGRCNSYGARAWHRRRGQCPNALPMAWMKQRRRQASA